jgi:hypothetical protein
MEQLKNPFEVLMEEYVQNVDRAYEEGGKDAATIMEMRMSIKKAAALAEMGMKAEAIEELEDVCDATAMGGMFEGTGIFDEAETAWKELKG